MTFEEAIKILNKNLRKENPKTFSSSWIFKNTPSAYRYFYKNVRTENDDVDWDRVTGSLSRTFQSRWIRYKYKQAKSYERQSEVDMILFKFSDRLYVLLSPKDEKEKHLQHKIFISLVRIGQKGNICAQNEVIKWVTFITDEWIDRYPQMHRWKGYTDEIPDKIRGCIRRYRYTGSFLGYLFRTLEYSAYGKPPLVSLNDTVFDGDKTLEDVAVVDENWRIYK